MTPLTGGSGEALQIAKALGFEGFQVKSLVLTVDAESAIRAEAVIYPTKEQVQALGGELEKFKGFGTVTADVTFHYEDDSRSMEERWAERVADVKAAYARMAIRQNRAFDQKMDCVTQRLWDLHRKVDALINDQRLTPPQRPMDDFKLLCLAIRDAIIIAVVGTVIALVIFQVVCFLVAP